MVCVCFHLELVGGSVWQATPPQVQLEESWNKLKKKNCCSASYNKLPTDWQTSGAMSCVYCPLVSFVFCIKVNVSTGNNLLHLAVGCSNCLTCLLIWPQHQGSSIHNHFAGNIFISTHLKGILMHAWSYTIKWDTAEAIKKHLQALSHIIGLGALRCKKTKPIKSSLENRWNLC